MFITYKLGTLICSKTARPESGIWD